MQEVVLNYLKINTVNKIIKMDIENTSYENIKKVLLEVQSEMLKALEDRKEKNHLYYTTSDLARKRKLKYIANSKTYIKKNWSNRKTKKDLILNHIKKIREVDKVSFSTSPALKREVVIYKKDEDKIMSLYLAKNSLQKIVDIIGYGTKQSLSNYLNKIKDK